MAGRGGRLAGRAGRDLRLGLVAWTLVSLGMAVVFRHQLSPDAVSYLRLARYYADGDLARAVSGYWSPLYSWLLVPWVAAGIDGRLAAKLLGVVVGLVWLLAVWSLTPRFIEREAVRRLVMVTAGLIAIEWNVATVTPDLLLAALVTTYLAVVADPDLARRPARCALAGAVAGLAYLAKAYALPFFLVHFPVAIVLARWADPASGRTRPGVRGALVGLATFAAVAGPWVGILSLTHGRPTFTTAVAFNQLTTAGTVGAETGAMRREQRLYPVPPGRLTAWETPELIAGLTPAAPSALTGAGGGRRLIENAAIILDTIAGFDAFHFAVPTLFGVAILLWRRRRDRPATRTYAWALFTVALYCGGYLPLVSEPRYFWPVVGLLVILTCHLAEVVGETEGFGRAGRGATVLALVVAVSYASVAVFLAQVSYRHRQPDYAAVARRLEAEARRAGHPIEGPLAGVPWAPTLFVAYALDVPMYGMPAVADVRGMAGELRTLGIRTLLVFHRPDVADALERDQGLARIATVTLPDGSGRPVIALAVGPAAARSSP